MEDVLLPDPDADPFHVSIARHVGQRLTKEVQNVHRLLLELEAVRALGNEKDIVQNLEHILTAKLGGAEHLVVGEEGVLSHGLETSQDAVEGGAQLVRHVRKEIEVAAVLVDGLSLLGLEGLDGLALLGEDLVGPVLLDLLDEAVDDGLVGLVPWFALLEMPLDVGREGVARGEGTVGLELLVGVTAPLALDDAQVGIHDEEGATGLDAVHNVDRLPLALQRDVLLGVHVVRLLR